MTLPQSTPSEALLVPPPDERRRIAPLPRWRSDQLLGDAPEAHIEHDGSVYRLRRTLLGKLILTK